MRALIAIIVLAYLSTTAHAGEHEPPERSEDIALLLPLGVTSLGVGLIAFAGDSQGPADKIMRYGGLATVIAGPSLGRIYARDISWLGSGLQLGGLAIAIGGVRASEGDGEIAAFMLGSAVFSVGAVYQIISAPIVVHRANKQRMALVPTGGAHDYGLAIAGSF